MDRISILEIWTPRLLSVLRIVSGLLFFEHGTAKLFQFPYMPMTDGIELFSMIGMAGIIELIGGALLALGLFTRPAAFISSGEMAFAYFIAHAPQGFFPILNQGELAIVYCFLFLYFAVAGGGPWSVDRIIGKRRGS